MGKYECCSRFDAKYRKLGERGKFETNAGTRSRVEKVGVSQKHVEGLETIKL